MNDNDIELGYEQVYRERLEETRSMVTLATLLDFLDQGAGDGYDYDSVMARARAIAERANQDGLPSPTPEVTLASSVMRSNVKIMIYNIIEFAVTSLIRAIYDRLKDESCGYADVSEKLRTLWHHTRMRTLSDPSASNDTAVRISKQLLDEAIANKALRLDTHKTISGGNLDGEKILKLFNDHGVSVHTADAEFRADELKDIKDRRNDLAHGSVSFAEASNQVTTSELAGLIDRVDSFLMQLRKDVIDYLDFGDYKANQVSKIAV